MSGLAIGEDGLRDLVQTLCAIGETTRPVKNSFGFTRRKIEIVQAVQEGYSNPEIAAKFSLSEQTVKHYLSHIFDKPGVFSRLELALFAGSARKCGRPSVEKHCSSRTLGGNRPTSNSYAAHWAFHSLPEMKSLPYPCESFGLRNSQHPVSGSIRIIE